MQLLEDVTSVDVNMMKPIWPPDSYTLQLFFFIWMRERERERERERWLLFVLHDINQVKACLKSIYICPYRKIVRSSQQVYMVISFTNQCLYRLDWLGSALCKQKPCTVLYYAFSMLQYLFHWWYFSWTNYICSWFMIALC